MEDDFKPIADFDMEIIINFFKGVIRQGPGSIEETKRALQFIPTLKENSKIADMGCGTGASTMVLAASTLSQITAVDLFPDMIKGLEEKIKAAGYENRVKGLVASMDASLFEENQFDVIWAEGSIYNIGFEKGLTKWHKLLKSNGMVAVTEASWFTNKRPKIIENFWKCNYPAIDTISANIKMLENSGYMPVANFILPETCWTDNFYVSVAERIEEFTKMYTDNDAIQQFLARAKEEIVLYDKYKDYYGYVFYIGKKLG